MDAKLKPKQPKNGRKGKESQSGMQTKGKGGRSKAQDQFTQNQAAALVPKARVPVPGLPTGSKTTERKNAKSKTASTNAKATAASVAKLARAILPARVAPSSLKNNNSRVALIKECLSLSNKRIMGVVPARVKQERQDAFEAYVRKSLQEKLTSFVPPLPTATATISLLPGKPELFGGSIRINGPDNTDEDYLEFVNFGRIIDKQKYEKFLELSSRAFVNTGNIHKLAACVKYGSYNPVLTDATVGLPIPPHCNVGTRELHSRYVERMRQYATTPPNTKSYLNTMLHIQQWTTKYFGPVLDQRTSFY